MAREESRKRGEGGGEEREGEESKGIEGIL